MPVQHRTKITPDNLDALAKQIQEAGISFQAQAELMRGDNLAEINVVAWQQTARGMRFIDSFLSLVRDAIAEARSERGDLPPLPSNGRKKRVPESPRKRPGK